MYACNTLNFDFLILGFRVLTSGEVFGASYVEIQGPGGYD
jgi:hypothetical protein